MVSFNINHQPRLLAGLEAVGKCNVLADIGTDHGFVSVYAVAKGIAQRAIATDISKKSLDKAIVLTEEMGLTDKIECRVGDGLVPLKPNEADVIFIAGMGGDLILRILAGSPKICTAAQSIVMIPMQNTSKLRAGLWRLPLKITRESLVRENGRIYEVIKAIPHKDTPYTLAEELLGRKGAREQGPLFKEYVTLKLEKVNKLLSLVPDEAQSRKEELIQHKEIFEKALKEL
ncbi:MAG: SAM-dependent methyltransferase [Clostridiales bacterium]|nr:SAM-dependent methyltransferase [Clostridiales bacterium]